MRITIHCFALSLTLSVGSLGFAQEFTVQKDETAYNEPDYSPFVDQHYPNRVYWGDTHLHTSNSPDAGLIGNTLGPDMAYRFARGEEITSSTNLRVQLNKPLDFLVVADHSEYLGLSPMLRTGDPALLADPTGKRWYDMFNAGSDQAYAAFREVVQSVVEGQLLIKNDDVMRTVWERNNATADEFNEPGQFTAFIGYEWSSLPGGKNLHRVVIFRDDSGRANQVVPFSSIDSPDAENLWTYLADYQAKTGGQVLAIAHNGNGSNGLGVDLIFTMVSTTYRHTIAGM